MLRLLIGMIGQKAWVKWGHNPHLFVLRVIK